MPRVRIHPVESEPVLIRLTDREIKILAELGRLTLGTMSPASGVRALLLELNLADPVVTDPPQDEE